MQHDRHLRIDLAGTGRQGADAKAFKYFDCPSLTDTQLRMLTKHFDRSVKYERINGKHFIKQRQP